MAGGKAGRTDKALAERRRKINEDFARRHPARAREQRALRKEAAAAAADYGHKRNGTVETHQKAGRTPQGALARLFMSGSISHDQLAWAAEIRVVAERICADVAIGTFSLETRVDNARVIGGAFFEKLGAVRAEVAYTKWRAGLQRAGPVLAMIVEDRPVGEVARSFAMSTRTLRGLLGQALDAWPDCNSEACDEVDAATLAAAQAAIL